MRDDPNNGCEGDYTLKGTTKLPSVDFLRLDTLTGTNSISLTPKRYDDQPCPFYIGFLPPTPGYFILFCDLLVECLKGTMQK